MSIADKLATIAENEQKVYEQGRKDEYDAFWDGYLRNCNGDCNTLFGGFGFTPNNFYPTKNISPTSAQRMFVLFMYERNFDLQKRLDDCGITLDFSKCKTLSECFSQAGVSRVGTIDCSNATSIAGLFAFCNQLVTIDKLIVTPTLGFTNVFYENYKLQNIIIEGTIGKSGFSTSYSTKLTKPSIISIINALSTTTSGLTVTLSKTAVNNAFGINVDDASTWGEGTEYYNLRHSKDNWTISYV